MLIQTLVPTQSPATRKVNESKASGQQTSNSSGMGWETIYAISLSAVFITAVLVVLGIWQCKRRQAQADLPKHVAEDLLAAQMMEKAARKLNAADGLHLKGRAVFDNPVYGEDDYAGYA